MIGGINFNTLQNYTTISSGRVNQNETDKNNVLNQAQAEEDELVSAEFEEGDFEADKVQLQEDWDYFTELKGLVESGDQDAINEVLSIDAADKVEETDENAVQYNKNTDLLLEIQAEARAFQANTEN